MAHSEKFGICSLESPFQSEEIHIESKYSNPKSLDKSGLDSKSGVSPLARTAIRRVFM